MPHKNKKMAMYGQDRGKQVERMCKRSHFTKEEVEKLLMMFREKSKLKQPQHINKISRQCFEDILHDSFGITDSVIGDRIFRVLDLDNDGHLSEEEWVYGLSVILKGTEEEQRKYCFSVYDLRDEGYWSKEGMIPFLKSCLVHQPLDEDSEEGPKELTDIVLRIMDPNIGGKIYYTDYTESIDKDALLKEILGPCIPPKKFSDAFLESISNAYTKEQ